MRPTLLLGAALLALTASPAQATILTLDVRASVRTSRDVGRDTRAMLQLGVDWETLFFGRARPLPSGGSAALEPAGSAAWPGLAEAAAEAPFPESVGENSPPEADRPPRNPAAQVPGLGRSEFRPAWARPAFALELVRAVLSLDRQGESRADSLSTRSRTSALLPVVRLRAGRGTDQSLRYSPTLDDPDRWLVAGGADYSYEAQLTWTFDRLVFNDDEIAVERLRQQAAKARGDRALRALRVLFAWQAARLRLLHEVLSAEDALELEIQAIQAESELDVLSRGWFSKRVAGL